MAANRSFLIVPGSETSHALHAAQADQAGLRAIAAEP
jgi:hypothetical protein